VALPIYPIDQPEVTEFRTETEQHEVIIMRGKSGCITEKSKSHELYNPRSQQKTRNFESGGDDVSKMKCDCIKLKGEHCSLCNPVKNFEKKISEKFNSKKYSDKQKDSFEQNKDNSQSQCSASRPKEHREMVYCTPPSRGRRGCDTSPISYIKCKICTLDNNMDSKECERCQSRILLHDGSIRISWNSLQAEQLKSQFSSSMIEKSFQQDVKEGMETLKNIKLYCDQVCIISSF